jgi:hypothetical protein
MPDIAGVRGATPGRHHVGRGGIVPSGGAELIVAINRIGVASIGFAGEYRFDPRRILFHVSPVKADPCEVEPC